MNISRVKREYVDEGGDKVGRSEGRQVCMRGNVLH